MILKRKNKVGGVSLPNFSTYCVTIAIKTMWWCVLAGMVQQVERPPANLVRAQALVAGQVPRKGCARGSQSMFLSLSFSLSSFLPKKQIKCLNKRQCGFVGRKDIQINVNRIENCDIDPYRYAPLILTKVPTQCPGGKRGFLTSDAGAISHRTSR